LFVFVTGFSICTWAGRGKIPSDFFRGAFAAGARFLMVFYSFFLRKILERVVLDKDSAVILGLGMGKKSNPDLVVVIEK
jgi:ABC-type enterochelin transport system permease subunit